jgi:hypothetical protein
MHGGNLDHNGARVRPTSTVEDWDSIVIRLFVEYQIIYFIFFRVLDKEVFY